VFTIENEALIPPNLLRELDACAVMFGV